MHAAKKMPKAMPLVSLSYLGRSHSSLGLPKMIRLNTSLLLVDGLAYNLEDGSLYFSDVQKNEILQLVDPFYLHSDPVGISPEVFRRPSGKRFCVSLAASAACS